MSGLGLESFMEGWSLNEGSGSMKKGSSMNAMRSTRGGAGMPGGLGQGITSSVGGRGSASFFLLLMFFFGKELTPILWHRRDPGPRPAYTLRALVSVVYPCADIPPLNHSIFVCSQSVVRVASCVGPPRRATAVLRPGRLTRE